MEIRVPAFAHGGQVSIEGLDTGVQEPRGTTWIPRHLRLLTAPFAHHLVNVGFSAAARYTTRLS